MSRAAQSEDPEVRYSQSQNGDQLCIARYSIAVDRKYARRNSQDANEVTADFFNCTAFGKQGEFVERYLKQGTKVLVTGRAENDNYTNKNGEKVYSIRIVTEEIEFAESKASSGQESGGYQPQAAPASPADASAEGFMKIPNGIENDLPFK